MPSKQVTDRQKTAAALQAAATVHGAALARATNELLAPWLREAEAAPDTGLLAELLGRAVEGAAARLVAADEAHQAESLDDAEPRDRRNQATAELSDALIEIRSTVRGLFGAAAEPRVLGVTGATAEDPVVLLRQAETMLARLADPGLELPKPKLAGVSVRPEAWTERLAPLAADLRSALGDVRREARELEATQSAKNEAMLEYDAKFSKIAGLLEAYLRLAGLDEIAEKLRPTSPRKPKAAQETTP